MAGLGFCGSGTSLMEEQAGGIDGAEADGPVVVDLGDDGSAGKWLELAAGGSVRVIVDDATDCGKWLHGSPSGWCCVDRFAGSSATTARAARRLARARSALALLSM
jgi:hypothetical protein